MRDRIHDVWWRVTRRVDSYRCADPRDRPERYGETLRRRVRQALCPTHHNFAWARWDCSDSPYVPGPYVEVIGCCRDCGALGLFIEETAA